MRMRSRDGRRIMRPVFLKDQVVGMNVLAWRDFTLGSTNYMTVTKHRPPGRDHPKGELVTCGDWVAYMQRQIASTDQLPRREWDARDGYIVGRMEPDCGIFFRGRNFNFVEHAFFYYSAMVLFAKRCKLNAVLT